MLTPPKNTVLRRLTPATCWSVVMILAALYIASKAARYLWLPSQQYSFVPQRAVYDRHGLVMMT
ncbi:MAG: hypothetical protein AAFU65_14310, partial [Pseudomonadota bacterium]